MAFLSELLTYSFKYIILLTITVAAVICGAKYKKNKIAKAALEAEIDNTEETEN